MKNEHKHNLICQCGWQGDISDSKRISDRGFIGGVWWFSQWRCPDCNSRLGEVNQNSPLTHPLMTFS